MIKSDRGTRALVSVIVTTRDSANTLEPCLRSIRSQTYKELELIVVDNASVDDTMRIARDYADVLETWGPERSAQRNHGANLATGDYLLFIDSDMILGLGVVMECVAALATREMPAVIISESTIGNGFWARCRALERSCYVGDDLVEAARFFRREAFESAGGFDEQLIAGEDWDLSIRTAKGLSLPRTKSVIVHDETGVTLWNRLSKKHYYARSFVPYWRKHKGTSLRQANLVLRPALIRNWRRLIREPVLLFGIFTLKSLELVASLVGIGTSALRGQVAGAGPVHPDRAPSSLDHH